MALFDFISRPLRGIGRLLRGKFREGIGDIGAGAKSLAPVLGLSGVGLPLAAIIGGAGGLAEAGTAPGAKFGDVLESAAGGAAGGAAGAGARSLLGIGRVAGAATAAAPAGAAAPAAATSIPGGAMGFGIPSATIPLPAAAAAPSVGLTSIGSTALKQPPRGIGRQILQFAKDNPEIAFGVLQGAANAYSGEQVGAAMDREVALREEIARRNVGRGGLGVRQGYDQWAAERDRLRGQYGYGG